MMNENNMMTSSCLINCIKLYKRLWKPKSISRCSYYMRNLIIQPLCIMMVKIKLWVVKFSAETNSASAFNWSTYHLLYSISICLCVSL